MPRPWPGLSTWLESMKNAAADADSVKQPAILTRSEASPRAADLLPALIRIDALAADYAAGHAVQVQSHWFCDNPFFLWHPHFEIM